MKKMLIVLLSIFALNTQMHAMEHAPKMYQQPTFMSTLKDTPVSFKIFLGSAAIITGLCVQAAWAKKNQKIPWINKKAVKYTAFSSLGLSFLGTMKSFLLD